MRACVHSAVHLRRSVVGRSRSATGPARTTLSRRGERSRAYRVDLRVRPRGAREIAIGKRAGEKTDFFFRLPPWETTRTARAARWSRCSSRCAPTRGCSATTASCGAACRRRSPSAWGTTSSGAHPHPCSEHFASFPPTRSDVFAPSDARPARGPTVARLLSFPGPVSFGPDRRDRGAAPRPRRACAPRAPRPPPRPRADSRDLYPSLSASSSRAMPTANRALRDSPRLSPQVLQAEQRLAVRHVRGSAGDRQRRDRHPAQGTAGC